MFVDKLYFTPVALREEVGKDEGETVSIWASVVWSIKSQKMVKNCQMSSFVYNKDFQLTHGGLKKPGNIHI